MVKNGGTDRRVKRTRSLLHEALASLIHEKSYDDIVVKEILARADVGRSTFYTHFSDKDDLLDSAVRDIVRAGESGSSRSARAPDHVLRFSTGLFEHIERYRHSMRSPAPRERLAVVHDHLEQELAALVAHDLERWSLQHGEGHGRVQHIPVDLLARHVASTFLVVLNWWLRTTTSVSATEANELFRSLVLPSLTQRRV